MHTADQSELAMDSRQSGQTIYLSVRRFSCPCSTQTSSEEDMLHQLEQRTTVVPKDTSRIEVYLLVLIFP